MTYFSADEVNEICDRLRKEHYPCDVIHLDTGWFRTDWLCEWKFNPPKGFVQHLKQNGFKVSLWQLPYVAQGAEQLEEAKANRYISQSTKTEDTSTGGASNFSALDYAGTIDFTYDKAVDWYKNQLLKPLLEMGVTCIKTDFGENIHMDHGHGSRHCLGTFRLGRLSTLSSALGRRQRLVVGRFGRLSQGRTPFRSFWLCFLESRRARIPQHS